MEMQPKLNLFAVNQRYKERVEKEIATSRGRRLPFLEIAALVLEFDLASLRELGQKLFQRTMTEEEERQLKEASNLSRYSGKYALKEARRKEILADLAAQGELVALFDRLPAEEGHMFSVLLGECLHRETIDLYALDLPALHTIEDMVEWLAPTSFADALPKAAAVKALISQERLLLYFKQQVKYFAGREKELSDLERYVDPFRERASGGAGKKALLVYGVGGIGKSTLIAKFITDLWRKDKADKMPFVYLDFDKIAVNAKGDKPFNPLILAEEAFRQLSIQFPATDELEDVLKDIQSFYEEDGGAAHQTKDYNPLKDIHRAIQNFLEDPSSVEQGDVVKSRGLTSTYTRGNLYDFIQRRIVQPEHRRQFEELNRAVLVVLDSFEEFQNVATSSEFYELLAFIGELREMIPQLVFVIAGRTDYFSAAFDYEPFEVGPFDRAAALGFLQGKGIHDREQQLRIADKAEGIPLALSLLANLTLQKEKELVQQGVRRFDWVAYFDELDRNHLNEQLVIRNVEHISEEVRELGIPGIIVRKITPDIIREVLAGPCKLGEISKERSWELFEALKREVFLLEEFENELYFRRDLRESIQSLIRKKYGNIVREIHDQAIRFYENKTEPSDRAEYLYHRLMRGDGVPVIDQYYTKDLRAYIERSLWEFDEAERVYLYGKLEKLMSAEELQKAPQKEWELYLVSQIREVIGAKGFGGFQEIAKMLGRREVRTDDSPLPGWESKIYERLGRFEEVERIYRRFRTEERPVPVKAALAMARKYELERDFDRAWTVVSPFAKDLDVITDFTDFIAWCFDFLRIGKRLGGADANLFDGLKRIEAYYGAFSAGQNPLLAADEEAWERNVKKTVPPAYAEATLLDRKETRAAFRDGSGFAQYLRRFYRHFLRGDDFIKLTEQIRVRFSLEKDESYARKEIGLFLDNRFHLFLEEVSEPGVLPVVVADFANFLEQAYRGDLNVMHSELIGKAADRSKTNEIQEEQTPVETKTPEAPADKSAELVRAGKREVKDLLANAEIEKALDVLKKLGAETGNERFVNDLVLLTSRLNRLSRDNRMGLLRSDEYALERNKIVYAILQIADEL